MWCSASNVSAIFDASLVSSTLSANLIDTACMLRSGFIFLINDKTRVESTPPLNAIETVLASKVSIFCFM